MTKALLRNGLSFGPLELYAMCKLHSDPLRELPRVVNLYSHLNFSLPKIPVGTQLIHVHKSMEQADFFSLCHTLRFFGALLRISSLSLFSFLISSSSRDNFMSTPLFL